MTHFCNFGPVSFSFRILQKQNKNQQKLLSRSNYYNWIQLGSANTRQIRPEPGPGQFDLKMIRTKKYMVLISASFNASFQEAWAPSKTFEIA